jgi:uncharacterized membrane protein HdeD (DUF308 family)
MGLRDGPGSTGRTSGAWLGQGWCSMEQVKSVASEYKPWRKDLPWYVVGLQGAVALAIGIYFVIEPDSAGSTIRLLLAVLLFVTSALDILTGFRNYQDPLVQRPMTPYLLVRGGAGVSIALMYFLSARSGYIAESDARYILGYGLLAYAIIGLVGVIMSMIKGEMHWMAAASNLLYLFIGAVLIYNNQESVEAERAVRFLGWAAIAGGAILLLYTYFLRMRQEAEAAAGPEVPAVAGVGSTGLGTAPGLTGTQPADPVTAGPITSSAPADAGTGTGDLQVGGDGSGGDNSVAR